MGDGLNSYASAANYRNESMATRTNAMLQRRQAYADAYKLESESESAMHIAGDQMMTMRRNQAEQVGARRAAAGASGISASGGSQLVQEQRVAEILEVAVANAARSASISDTSAREQANAMRRYGDTAYNVGMVQAEHQQKMARIANGVAPWLMLGQGLTTLGKAGVGSKYDTEWFGSANTGGK
jgi:hypothetical protein